MHRALATLCTLAIAFAAAAEEFVTIERGELKWVVGGNDALGEHRAGYNGVISVTPLTGGKNAFVPSYAGLNLEHYFDARQRHPDAAVFFEPRHIPMEVRRVSEDTVELYQAETPFYGVESWTRFTASAPYYMDMSFRCIPRQDVFEGGFMGVFWASYINAPEDKSIYFLQADATLDNPKWAQFCTQQHGRDSTVVAVTDTTRFDYPEAGGTLFNSISPLRFAEPFFYGRLGDRVLIYIFDENPYLRFAHSPSGGGRRPDGTDTNPAWDFQLVIPDYQVGQEYGLSMRLVYKSWVSREDVIDEVREYRAQSN